jgi:hypothetical protein
MSAKFQKFLGTFKTARDLKPPARAEKFRDFGGFPAILLNFRLTIRVSNDRAEMRPTSPDKPHKFKRGAEAAIGTMWSSSA